MGTEWTLRPHLLSGSASWRGFQRGPDMPGPVKPWIRGAWLQPGPPSIRSSWSRVAHHGAVSIWTPLTASPPPPALCTARSTGGPRGPPLGRVSASPPGAVPSIRAASHWTLVPPHAPQVGPRIMVGRGRSCHRLRGRLPSRWAPMRRKVLGASGWEPWGRSLTPAACPWGRHHPAAWVKGWVSGETPRGAQRPFQAPSLSKAQGPPRTS